MTTTASVDSDRTANAYHIRNARTSTSEFLGDRGVYAYYILHYACNTIRVCVCEV